MITPTALEEAWRTLEAGAQPENLVRSLSDFGITEGRMLLAVENGQREILFPAGASFVLPERLAARGVRLAVRTQGTGAIGGSYLVMRCTNPDFHGVFRRFSAAVVEQVRGAADPAKAAVECISRWAEMFERAGSKSKTALLGIYGELDELVNLARRGAEALSAWVGPDGRPQDFIRGPIALEVKTHQALVPSTEIHGLEQLWTSPFETLVLAVKQVVFDAGGERLSDVIARAQAAGVSGSQLRERLDALDLDSERLASLDARYAHRGTRYFRVMPDAPALTPDDLIAPLHPGVSSIRYRVALGSPGFEPIAGSELEHVLARLATGSLSA